jgi:hypothetical protein
MWGDFTGEKKFENCENWRKDDITEEHERDVCLSFKIQ